MVGRANWIKKAQPPKIKIKISQFSFSFLDNYISFLLSFGIKFSIFSIYFVYKTDVNREYLYSHVFHRPIILSALYFLYFLKTWGKEKTEKSRKKMGSVEGEKKALGWAARDPSGVLSPYSYTLRFLIPSSSVYKNIFDF